MALTKIITDTIDLSSDTTALKMPKGTTAQRPGSVSIDYLIVGGGGGGAGVGGAGGAGGLRTSYGSVSGGGAGAETALVLNIATNYTVTIGEGGVASSGGSPNYDGYNGASGDDSVFSTITSTGGGGGGSSSNNALNGGSGGGSRFGTPGNGISGQGFNGGDDGVLTNTIGGGGGGAAEAGNTTGNNGGDGLAIAITGSSVTYAGGGGGGGNTGGSTPYDIGLGGSGGGGDGGYNDGTPNTGGGGGGGTWTNNTNNNTQKGGAGGSGIIILRVASTVTATFSAGVTSTLTQVGGGAWSSGDKIYTITATSSSSETVSFTELTPTIGETRENTTTGKMEIYTGVKGWRALQQTDQAAAGVVPSNNFKSVLYTGNSTSGAYADVPYGQQNIEIGFTSDLSWFKTIGSGSTGTSSTTVYDVIRGDYNYMNTSSEYPSGNSGMPGGNAGGARLTNGVTVGDVTDGSYGVNGSSTTGYTDTSYVSWNWKAGGQPTASNSNTAGSMLADSVSIDGVLQSTYTPSGSPGVYPKKMSINTEAGFNIIEWENPGSPYTQSIPHGLSGAPDLMIVKLYELGPGAAGTWFVYTKTTGEDAYLKLNTNDATTSGSGSEFINVGANTFQFSYSGGAKTVGYFFKSTPGFSLIGSYMGTGSSTNTPIIYTGFEPAWIMVKCVDSSRAWNITDNKRSTTNPRDSVLQAQSSDPAYTSSTYNINFYNDGFQIGNADTGWNTKKENYIFMCFAS